MSAPAFDPKRRRCQVAGCDYSEERGSNLGEFFHGHFVCPAHAEAFRAVSKLLFDSEPGDGPPWDLMQGGER